MISYGPLSGIHASLLATFFTFSQSWFEREPELPTSSRRSSGSTYLFSSVFISLGDVRTRCLIVANVWISSSHYDTHI